MQREFAGGVRLSLGERSPAIQVCSIVGARPQFVKYFAISEAIKKHNLNSDIRLIDRLIHTGQHYNYNMSRLFFDELGIKAPDHHLEVGSGSHGRQTAEIVRKTEAVLMTMQPDLVILFGDTNSTLGGALAAAKLHIPIAHVEAGLRSFNRRMPEELNRILTDRLSHLLFCPSRPAIAHLSDEGFRQVLHHGEHISLSDTQAITDPGEPLVINTGDVMYDVFIKATQLAQKKASILNNLGLKVHSFGVMTLHRAENTDDPEIFEEILDFLNRILDDVPVIFPVHPRTADLIEQHRGRLPACVQPIEAVSYFDLLQLLHRAEFILTDSGGLQKEAYWARVPCVTLRQETEWIETVDSGWNQLYRQFSGWRRPASHPDFYGDGHAAERMIRQCVAWISAFRRFTGNSSTGR